MLADFEIMSRPRLLDRRRVRREVADLEHRPKQLGLRQDRLRLRNHVRGRVLAAPRRARFTTQLSLLRFPRWYDHLAGVVAHDQGTGKNDGCSCYHQSVERT